MDIRKKQRAVVEALEDIKARDIVVYNVAKQTAHFERVIIASGDSSRQVNALAAHVQAKLKALGSPVKGLEGQRTGDWVLVDLGDIVVHVMHPAIRSHYNLEELWGEKEVKLKTEAKPKPVARPKGKPATRPKAAATPKASATPRGKSRKAKPVRAKKAPARAKASRRRGRQ